MARIRSERETTITFNEAEAEAEICSVSLRFHRHMEKRGIEPYKIEPARFGADESEQSRWYRMPKDWLRIRPRRRVSDAERARLTAQGFQGRREREGKPPLPRAKRVRPVNTPSTSSPNIDPPS